MFEFIYWFLSYHAGFQSFGILILNNNYQSSRSCLFLLIELFHEPIFIRLASHFFVNKDHIFM